MIPEVSLNSETIPQEEEELFFFHADTEKQKYMA